MKIAYPKSIKVLPIKFFVKHDKTLMKTLPTKCCPWFLVPQR